MPGFGGYVQQLRPRSWPIVFCHYAAGFFTASGFRLQAADLFYFVLGGALWAVLLNGGALGLDMALDRPKRGTQTPRFAGELAVLLIFTGLMLSLLMPRSYSALFLTCYILAVCYSAEPVRLKARRGLDYLAVAAGYGLFTTLSGWAASGTAFEMRMDLAAAGFFFLLAGVYPLLRGAPAGERGAAAGGDAEGCNPGPSACTAFFVLAFVFFLLAAVAAGVRFRALALLVPAACWTVFLVVRMRGGGAAPPDRAIWGACAIWALTDISCVIALAP